MSEEEYGTPEARADPPASPGAGFDVELCLSLITGLGRIKVQEDGSEEYVKHDDCLGGWAPGRPAKAWSRTYCKHLRRKGDPQ